jgi:hypothetical protein
VFLEISNFLSFHHLYSSFFAHEAENKPPRVKTTLKKKTILLLFRFTESETLAQT